MIFATINYGDSLMFVFGGLLTFYLWDKYDE